ncbi:MAG: hypothetical protein J6Z35_02380 [Lachnospiraceae bacterium]|nr:hypothetical protein [Lachnospiraceae bacterium]
MSKFERKFGKYAIPNLTLILIICYVVGYATELLNPELIYTLALNPERILHGQVWRLLTWILIPSDNLDFLQLLCYFFIIGLEQRWKERLEHIDIIHIFLEGYC